MLNDDDVRFTDVHCQSMMKFCRVYHGKMGPVSKIPFLRRCGLDANSKSSYKTQVTRITAESVVHLHFYLNLTRCYLSCHNNIIRIVSITSYYF